MSVDDAFTVRSYAESIHVDTDNRFKGNATDDSGDSCRFVVKGSKDSSGNSSITEMIHNSTVMTNYSTGTLTLDVTIYAEAGQIETFQGKTASFDLKFIVETA